MILCLRKDYLHCRCLNEKSANFSYGYSVKKVCLNYLETSKPKRPRKKEGFTCLNTVVDRAAQFHVFAVGVSRVR